MYELKILKHLCNGKGCHLCAEVLPGFIDEHNGECELDEGTLNTHLDAIETGLQYCPTGALDLKVFK